MTELDFPNIQGLVVRGYRLPAADYIFLRIEEPVRGLCSPCRSRASS